MSDHRDIEVSVMNTGAVYSTGAPCFNVFRAPAEATLVGVDILTGTTKAFSTGAGCINVWNRGAAGATGDRLGRISFNYTGGTVIEGGRSTVTEDIPTSLTEHHLTAALADLDAGDTIVVEFADTGIDGVTPINGSANFTDVETALIVKWVLGTAAHED